MSEFSKFLRYFGLVCLIFFNGCQVGPSYSPPETITPEQWKNSTIDPAMQKRVCVWWEIFEDELLDELELYALENNNDLYAALDRVAQARAIAGVARADLYPQLTLNPLYSNQDVLSKIYLSIPPIPPLIREHQLIYELPLNLSYELDLWGLRRSAFQSAVFDAQAEEKALQTALLVLTTDLANSYFNLRVLDTQLQLYRETIETRKKAFDINRDRYEGKVVNYSDVSRAALELTNVEADYEEATRLRAIEENRIAVLLGVTASEFCLDAMPIYEDPPLIPAGVPSDVLLQRPDIAEAERHMAAEQALIRVAYASFFPSITLTGALGFSSPDLEHFLSWRSRYWALGAMGNQTIFDAGRKCSQLNLAVARFQEADRAYQQQVLIAFQEVEDALSNIELYWKESEKLASSVQSAKTTYQISYDRYIQGITFYLDVVDSERDVLNAERNLIAILGSRYSSTIQLIKALGGSWSLESCSEKSS